MIDLPGELSDYLVNGQVSYPRMYEVRDPSNPLLLIYVIDRDSSPSVNSNTVGSRTALFGDTQEKVDVVGLAMALPVNVNEAEEAAITSSEFWTLGGINHEF